MLYSRLAVAIAQENVGKKVGEQCPVFKARLKIFERHFEPPLPPDNLDLKEITNPDQEWDVVNIQHTNWLAGEQMLVGQEVGERWVTLPRAYARFQFVTQEKISGGQVQVKVIRSYANAPNVVTGAVTAEALVHGDLITVHDPFNLWSDIEPNATGWAYLAFGQEDDTSTTEVNESHVARYEIEECSLPTNEITGRLRDCLMGGQNYATVILDTATDTPVDQYSKRSSYPNVDRIPSAETTDYSQCLLLPDVQNRWKLDGQAGSLCVVRRITNRQYSKPENYGGVVTSSTSQQWELVAVERKLARHAKVTMNSPGQWSVTSVFYDGFDPTQVAPGGDVCDAQACSEPTVTCDLCEVCDPPNTPWTGFAFLDTTASTPTYIVYATDSAFYGPYQDITHVSDIQPSSSANCCFDVYKEQFKGWCKQEPTYEIVCMETISVPVVQGVSIVPNYDPDPSNPESEPYQALCFDLINIEVCGYSDATDICLDYCCEVDPPPPSNCGECEYCDQPNDGFRVNYITFSDNAPDLDCVCSDSTTSGVSGSITGSGSNNGCCHTYQFDWSGGSGDCNHVGSVTVCRNASGFRITFNNTTSQHNPAAVQGNDGQCDWLNGASTSYDIAVASGECSTQGILSGSGPSGSGLNNGQTLTWNISACVP